MDETGIGVIARPFLAPLAVPSGSLRIFVPRAALLASLLTEAIFSCRVGTLPAVECRTGYISSAHSHAGIHPFALGHVPNASTSKPFPAPALPTKTGNFEATFFECKRRTRVKKKRQSNSSHAISSQHTTYISYEWYRQR